MSERATPFSLVFTEIGPDRFPAVARALRLQGRASVDRDAFVLLEPVAHLVRELAGTDVTAEEMEAHLLLLHHAFRHWEAGGVVYRLREETLAHAVAQDLIAADPPHPALYIQVPAGRVWRSRAGDPAPEPLDGMFVTRTADPGMMAVLGVFGMHRTRPGFSATGVEGRADEHPAGLGERALAVRRSDGSPLFAPLLTGGTGVGLYSVLDPDELMLLTWRILALEELRNAECGMRNGDTGFLPEGERIVQI